MDGLQVSVMVWLLLKLTFDPVTAQALLEPSRCPTCPEGYFVMKNCSVMTTLGRVTFNGVRCKPCTNCSADDRSTLRQCSTFADSQCGSKAVVTTPADSPVSAPEVWIILTVISLSSFLILSLSLLVALLVCRERQTHQLKGLDV